MMTCTASRGFLSLSPCGAPATRPCSSCGQLTCPDHLSPSSGFSHCLSCANGAATQRDDRDTRGASTTDDTVDDADSSYRYRESYYSDRGYTPMSRSFDRSDSAAFGRATAVGAVAATDHDDHPGFGDS